MSDIATLQWPRHFPPTDPWKKFFYGVRWLGPDISFFKELKQAQATRTQEVMAAWPDTEQKKIALLFGESISRQIGWKTPYFLPQDKTAVIAFGPQFLMLEEFLWESAISDFEKQISRKLDDKFWQDATDLNGKDSTFEQFIHVVKIKLDEK